MRRYSNTTHARPFLLTPLCSGHTTDLYLDASTSCGLERAGVSTILL